MFIKADMERKRMSTHKISSRATIITQSIVGKIFSFFGYTHAGFWGIGLIAMIRGEIERSGIGIGMAVFSIVIGGLSIYNGIRIKNRIKRFKRYISLISINRITSIELLATHTNKPVVFVKKDLQEMISKKFFKYAFIDGVKGEIVIPAMEHGLDGESTVDKVNFNCSRCGAPGVYEKNRSAACEYCGSAVS